eukprot:947596-Lingulodinium_polyedra.AAC.1
MLWLLVLRVVLFMLLPLYVDPPNAFDARMPLMPLTPLMPTMPLGALMPLTPSAPSMPFDGLAA